MSPSTAVKNSERSRHQRHDRAGVHRGRLRLQCPGPILKLYNKIKEVDEGDIVTVQATDFGFTSDVEAWANSTGNRLLSVDTEGGVIVARIQKGTRQKRSWPSLGAKQDHGDLFRRPGQSHRRLHHRQRRDRLRSPSLMFFTFWGLNLLRKK
jgi:TusA-related sulfurtransferase